MNKVLYSTAKQLAEKGFNAKCSHVYENHDYEDHEGNIETVCAPCFMEGESAVDKDDIERVIEKYKEYYENVEVYLYPYQYQIIDWLRWKYNIILQVNPIYNHESSTWKYGWKIIKLYDDGKTETWWDNTYMSDVDAYEEGIKACLVNLI